MKKILPGLLLLLIGNIAIAQFKSISSPATIDANDSIIFNLGQANTVGSYVEFPVSFRSDDVINAVDFSIKLNPTSLVFDSVIRLAGYLSISANYNTDDSTLYFTSYSLQTITNDTPLVKVRFTLLLGPICSVDLAPTLAYLNGDACSAGIIGCITTGISETDHKNNTVTVFPNPTNGLATLKFSSAVKENGDLSIADLTGRIILSREISTIEGSNTYSVDISNLSSGVYLLNINTSRGNRIIRIVKD